MVARDSRFLIAAEGDGVVEYVDANEIVIRYITTDDEKFVVLKMMLRHYTSKIR